MPITPQAYSIILNTFPFSINPYSSMKMSIFKQLSIRLLLSLFLFPSSSAKTHADFLQCLLTHQPNGNSTAIIYTPNNSSYSATLSSYITNPRITYSLFKPLLIFTPSHESQIQTALHCSNLHGLQIRVRSGGHDYEGQSYTCTTPFVIIDLRNLRSISIDTTEKTAWIQAGATLGEVYYNIASKSSTLGFTAGTCATVGVGGHFSGGGYGMMSRKFGLAADNVVDAKIIDVNGRILDRKSMGEDLFWAIRGGGGGSFGIVVSWKVKLLDIPEKVTVFNVTRTLPQNATQLVYKWQHIAHTLDNNLLIRLFITTYGQSYFQVSFKALFVGGIKELLNLMQNSFPELGVLIEDCTEMSWIESVLYFADFPKGVSTDVLLNRTTQSIAEGRYYLKAKSDYVQHVIPTDGLEGIWKLLNEEQLVQVQFSPYGGKMNDYTEAETPFPHRAGNIFIIHYMVIWQKPEESSKHIAWIQKLYEYMSRYVSKSPRAAYVNYKDLDLGVNNKEKTSYAQASIWGMKYFKNNFKRLVQIKTRVDPANFFRSEQSIPPQN